MDGGQTAGYMYSADGLRVRSTVGSNFFEFIHDADGETVGVLGTNGALVRQEVGGFATFNSSGTFFHHRDLLGNLRVITDQTGTVQQTCTNLPYGDALSCAAGSITPLSFTGYMRDSETNLDFANARHYSSQFGRFMSPDPLGGDISNPQSLNRYAYVLNSPLSAIDPSGMDGCVLNNGVFDWVVTSGGAGGGDGGPIGSGGGPFGGAVTGLGGGAVAFCRFIDCGFGGSGTSLPGPPSASQIQSEANLGSSTGGDIVTGVAGELTNTLRPIAIFSAIQQGQWYTAWQIHKLPEYAPANSTQATASKVTFWASLLIPVGGEEAAAGKIGSKIMARIAELTAGAQERFPKLADKIQLHHIIPKYLGGAANGERRAINAAYHQLITNAFRELAPYGRKFKGSVEELLDNVYKRFPLP